MPGIVRKDIDTAVAPKNGKNVKGSPSKHLENAKQAQQKVEASSQAPESAGASKADKLAAAKTLFQSSDAETIVAQITVDLATLEENMEFLQTLSGDKKDKMLRLKTIQVLGQLCNTFLPFDARSVHLLNHLPLLVSASEDRDAAVRTESQAVREKLVAALSPYAVQYVFSNVLEGLKSERKWQSKLASLELLRGLAKNAASQLSVLLPQAVAPLTSVLWDTKQEVCDTAKLCILECFGIVSNPDIVPFVPALAQAMTNLEDVPETVYQLSSTTFVHQVDACALSIIEPLLTRAFQDPKVAVKRQAAVIIENMSKLVEKPHEVEPFLIHLLPQLERAAELVADPEARGVIARVHEQLLKIKAQVIPLDLSPSLFVKAINEAVAAHSSKTVDETTVNYFAQVCISLVLNDIVNDETLISCWNELIDPVLSTVVEASKVEAANKQLLAACQKYAKANVIEDQDDGVDNLCDFKFTLAYGSKILLHNAHIRLKRGHRYGLLGGNDSGKSTLMRSMALGQLEGFPSPDELRTVFVEADIQGELSHLACLEYVFQDPRIAAAKVTREEVSKVMLSVGFTDKMQNDAVTTLSGGWRMKLALSRAMLQKADILLLDEPTNHLDVINVAWVQNYLNSLTQTTCIMVSHDAGLLEKCCTDILQIDNLKLKAFKGNLSAFVELNPSAKSFFELKSEKFTFKFPKPGNLPGVSSRGKAIMKMDHVSFTYPGNAKPTLTNITVRVSMASRVACVGVNGAGKSTMIKLLTGELIPCSGTTWTHDNLRMAYVAQHAFHHIEKHMNKTPNEYIRWRYDNGEDKEEIAKVTLQITDEDREFLSKPVQVSVLNNKGDPIKVKRVFEDLTGSRRPGARGTFEYEVSWVGCSHDDNTFMTTKQLDEMGASKHMKHVDMKANAQLGMYRRTLSAANVEKHLSDVGLEPSYASHHRMSALSGGQKVKVVLAAAMWNQPHILILDEPTNYLDRDSLGALAGAIREYEGGVVMITHNKQFCESLCPETWMLENGTLDCQGDAEWMKAQDVKVEFQAVEEMVDALGNTSKVKNKKVKMNRQQRKAYEKLKAARKARGEDVSDSEDED